MVLSTELGGVRRGKRDEFEGSESESYEGEDKYEGEGQEEEYGEESGQMMEEYGEQLQYQRKDSKRVEYANMEGMSGKHLQERKNAQVPNKMYFYSVHY
jgi:hypothetical protein